MGAQRLKSMAVAVTVMKTISFCGPLLFGMVKNLAPHISATHQGCAELSVGSLDQNCKSERNSRLETHE